MSLAFQTNKDASAIRAVKRNSINTAPV